MKQPPERVAALVAAKTKLAVIRGIVAVCRREVVSGSVCMKLIEAVLDAGVSQSWPDEAKKAGGDG